MKKANQKGTLATQKPNTEGNSSVKPNEIKLPSDMPDKWLEQLQDRLKTSTSRLFWTTFLSSSVIAAVITGIVNYRLEAYKQQSATQLESLKKEVTIEVEKEKVRLQNRNAELNKRKTAYDSLQENFQKFSLALNLYITACAASFERPEDATLAGFEKKHMEILVKQMNSMTTSTKPDELKNIDDKIDAVLEIVSRNFQQLSLPGDYPKLKNVHEKEVAPQIEEVKTLFEQEKKKLEL